MSDNRDVQAEQEVSGVDETVQDAEVIQEEQSSPEAESDATQRIYELETALKEMERVGTHGYIMLESYRNEQELFNLQCWALTCESFFDHEEWPWIYKHFGYSGDYEFIYFE